MDGLEKRVNERALITLRRANEFTDELLRNAQSLSGKFLQEAGISAADICLVAVGSVGRREALEASDLDVLPVLRNAEALKRYTIHDQSLRKQLSDGLELKVSQGADLTKPTAIDDLTNADTIGGDTDDSTALTKRVLVLTESVSAGGALELPEIREQLLAAYADQERTRGRHVLSLCNDIARYYRTLCIEYKAKVDVHAKDWCTRNLKLRHSRKLWYFATLLQIAKVASECPIGGQEFVKRLLEAFAMPPLERLVAAAPDNSHAIAAVVESFAWFLEMMADAGHRTTLENVQHSERYEPRPDNPFPGLKANSDLMHREMTAVLDELEVPVRQRVIDWFLL